MAQTIGQQLQQARKQRGVSLEQAAQVTRVRAFYLDALETDNPSALPSKVQGRGFLRLYASYLKLDPEPMLAAWEGKPAPVARAFRRVEEPDEEVVAPPQTGSQSVREPPQLAPSPIEIPDVDSVDAPVVSSADHAPAEKTAVDQGVSRPVSHPPIASSTDGFKHLTESGSRPPASPPRQPVAGPSKPGYLPGQTRSESQIILQEIGQQLKQQREFLGLSLAEVEKYTRLRLHYLKALENGSMDDLPSTVQGRGMLNNYANFLNLDSDALLLRYADALQLGRVERLGAGRSSRTSADNPSRRVPARSAGLHSCAGCSPLT